MKITRKAHGENYRDRMILDQDGGAGGWFEESKQFRMIGFGKYNQTDSAFTVEITPSEFIQMLESLSKHQSEIAVRAQISAMAAYLKEILESDPCPPAEGED